MHLSRALVPVQRIWQRLQDLRARKKAGLTVGVLGCMAERLKARMHTHEKRVFGFYAD